MTTVFSTTVFATLKKTLNAVVTDKTDNLESTMTCLKYLKAGTMDDQYIDDLTIAGPGLASEVPEGTELPTGEVRQGFLKRYTARKIGHKLIITDETMEDSKYPEAVKFARFLKKSLYQTMAIDGASVLIRATDTGYPGGDGVPLASASHTLPHGGVYSNTLATPMAPSHVSIGIMSTQARKMPGFNGVEEGYELEMLVGPEEYRHLFYNLTMADMTPEAGNFSEINTVKKLLGLKFETDKFWNNTETHWGATTSAEDGLKWFWRRKPTPKTWVENSHEIAMHSISTRYTFGWTNPRGFMFSNS